MNKKRRGDGDSAYAESRRQTEIYKSIINIKIYDYE